MNLYTISFRKPNGKKVTMSPYSADEVGDLVSRLVERGNVVTNVARIGR